jgi:membrane protease YdiL (CAAX protease family)
MVLFGGWDLSPLVPYLVLAIFPVAYLVGYSFNPVDFAWAFHHGFRPMPGEIRDKAEDIRRYANFLGDILVLSFIATLMLRNSVPMARVGLHLENWKSNAALGITAATLLVTVQSLVAKFFRSSPSKQFAYSVRRGSILTWVLIFIAGSFSEELWIAFCLIALMATKHSAPVSIAMTMIAFAAIHYGYGLGGALAVAIKGTLSALLFLWTGSLVPSFLYHFIGNLGSLYRARRTV